MLRFGVGKALAGYKAEISCQYQVLIQYCRYVPSDKGDKVYVPLSAVLILSRTPEDTAVYSWLNSTAQAGCALLSLLAHASQITANFNSMIRSEGGEVLLAPVSFADVRRISHVFNSAFSREPGSAYCR
jgi:hypothetical protein